MRAAGDLVANHRMWTPLGPDTGGGADGVAFVLPGGRGACTDEVLDEYRLHGTFIGLGCLLHGSLTYFGLWTGLALALGEEMMRLGDDFFARYAPVAFRRMAKVRALTPASPIWAPNTTAEADDPHHLVCEELGENLAEAGGNTHRTAAAHAALVQRIWCKLLLCNKEPWQHPAFRALRDGFNLVFGGRGNLLQITKEHGFSIPSLCVAMADRHVHDVEDFVQRIELYKATDGDPLAILPRHQRAAFPKVAAMVVELVRHYARGRGHTPQSLQDTPDLTAQHPAADADECFRATLLLQACYAHLTTPVFPLRFTSSLRR
ncbi:hypothetical protein K523DRAFT_359172 [Schizophyllum commune Tattone D]|nr:hypothetical protein K523DRAFT_359172 [Schizophyllum commune Tattone D]